MGASLAYNNSGLVLATGGDNVVKLWNASDLKAIGQTRKFKTYITNVAFSKNQT